MPQVPTPIDAALYPLLPLLQEPSCGALLSAPKLMFEFDLSGRRDPPLRKRKALQLQASADGILNCVCHWAELELLAGNG